MPQRTECHLQSTQILVKDCVRGRSQQKGLAALVFLTISVWVMGSKHVVSFGFGRGHEWPRSVAAGDEVMGQGRKQSVYTYSLTRWGV